MLVAVEGLTMPVRSKLWLVALILPPLALSTLAAVEYRCGFVTGYHVEGAPLIRSPCLRLDLKQALHLQRFYSQLGQDKWILGNVYPGVRNGYFVEVGAWDADLDSNSKALEEAGWTGVCVEPFPQHWTHRTCRLFKEAVSSRKGERIQFRAAGPFGGIDEHIEAHRKDVRTAPVVELETTTIGDVLQRAGAPHYIQYMSIDTEGSEFDILQGLPFDEYVVGALTIEHNFEEPKRSRINGLLASQGYHWLEPSMSTTGTSETPYRASPAELRPTATASTVMIRA